MTTTPQPDEPTGPDGLPKFPVSSGEPAPSGVPSPDLTPPAAVRLAVRLMRVGALVSVLSTIVAMATYGSFKDDVAEQMRASDPNISQDLIDTSIAVGITFSVAVGLLGAVVWLWMAWKNGQGRAWARIVATVLGGLNIVFTLLGFASGQAGPAVLVLSLVNLALAISILVLLWKKESSAFYAAASNRNTAT